MPASSRSILLPRLGYVLGFLACAGLIGFALYLQYYEYQDPCPLCLLQRIVYIALMVVFLVAAMHGPARTGSTVYGGLAVLTAAIGAAIATRHVWLQHLPKDQVPQCGPSLEFMLRKYSVFQTLEKVLGGSGQCAEVGWKFLGLSIAEWSLIWFVLFAIYAIYLVVFARKS